MNINITARKTIVKDSFKEKVEKKLSRFDRFFDHSADASVTVTNEQGRETVEITIKSRGLLYRAEKTTDDRADSLDGVVDLLFKQIVKNKERLEKKLRENAFTEAFEESYDDFEQDEIKIVKNKKFPIKPMSPEEAVLQMNLLGHQFYMFSNALTDEINVVYSRKMGQYGLIEPGVFDDDED